MTDFPMNISTDEVRPFLLRSKKRDEDYRRQMRDLVSAFRGKTLPLNNPADARWMVCDLHDTIYSEREDVVKGWDTFYLPDEVRMQVIGVVKGTSCPCDQLVLMTCEDRKLYVFDGEELHVVAGSLELLCAEGMEYPAPLSYYKGEAFKDMNDEDWDKLQQGAVGKSLDTAHDKLVTRHKPRFLRNLFRGGDREKRGRKREDDLQQSWRTERLNSKILALAVQDELPNQAPALLDDWPGEKRPLQESPQEADGVAIPEPVY
uniref:uncharacterized protein n=1 Tax=Semicossyphus pulcher TaxID=241346 RepID=UPI0037E9BD23